MTVQTPRRDLLTDPILRLVCDARSSPSGTGSEAIEAVIAVDDFAPEDLALATDGKPIAKPRLTQARKNSLH